MAACVAGSCPPGVEVLEHPGEPIDLVDLLDGVAEVWIVDVVCSHAPAGTLHRLDASAAPLPAELFAVSTHRLGLADALELARALRRLAPRVIVHGIEGTEFEPGQPLSAPVALAAEKLARALVDELAGVPVAGAVAAPDVTPTSD